jgi:lipopolysaccharide biosynthesis protein
MTEPELPFGIRRSAAHVESAPKIEAVPSVRAVAFYLPQFHPIPANDRAWGEGFTEWHNVTRAQPEFTGHHQPRLPANYGYYDLRLPEIQVRQARDASAAGIHAFCYHYYWFDGEQPLLLPLLNHLENPEISLPFCICFANENWTRRWDGLDRDVIFEQTYGDRFAEAFWSDAEQFCASRNKIVSSMAARFFW